MSTLDGDADARALWVLFIIATFLSQITILNMLIAIMGDTFDAVLEKQEQYALKEKVSILSDFVSIVESDYYLLFWRVHNHKGAFGVIELEIVVEGFNFDIMKESL